MGEGFGKLRDCCLAVFGGKHEWSASVSRFRGFDCCELGGPFRVGSGLAEGPAGDRSEVDQLSGKFCGKAGAGREPVL